MNPLSFEALLEKEYDAWNHKESPNPAVWKLYLSKTGFLASISDAEARSVIQLLKQQLPADAAFYLLSGTRLQENVVGGLGSDFYRIEFASAQPAQAGEGEIFLDRLLAGLRG